MDLTVLPLVKKQYAICAFLMQSQSRDITPTYPHFQQNRMRLLQLRVGVLAIHISNIVSLGLGGRRERRSLQVIFWIPVIVGCFAVEK